MNTLEENVSAEENSALLDTKQEKMQDEAPNLKLKLKGLTSSILYVIICCISAVTVQLLDRSIPDFELNTFRAGAALFVSCIAVLYTKKLPYIPKSEIFGVCLYSSASVTTSITYFIGISLVPAASGQCTAITFNILSGIVLFALFCNEKPTILVLVSATICTVGLFMVIQPIHMIYNRTYSSVNTSHSDVTEAPEEISRNFSLGNILMYIFPVITGLANTLDTLLLKRNPYLNQNMVEATFWCVFANSLISLVVMFTAETPVLPNDLYNTVLVLIHSVPYVASFYLIMYAARTISGNTFNIICCSSTVFLLIAQYTILSSILPGHRNWLEVVGVVLVTSGSILSSIVEVVKNEPVMGQKAD